MAKMNGKASGMANGAATKRSDNNDKSIAAPAPGKMTRDSEKVLARFPQHRDSGTAMRPKVEMNDMENPHALRDGKEYLRNMHNEVKGPTFDQTKSIHGRMAGQSAMDRRED